MMLALVAVAFGLYTITLVSASKRFPLRRARMFTLISLALAIVADFWATMLMLAEAKGVTWDLHTALGTFALSAMSILFFVAAVAVENERAFPSFRTFYRWAYALWMASFVAGFIEHAL